MARRRKWLDRKLMKQLAQAQLTNEEIAVCLKVSADTLERRYAGAIKEWKRQGVGSVRRKLFILAMSDEKNAATGMIFFLKNYAGMADVIREEPKAADFGNLPRTDLSARSIEAGKPN